MTFKADLTGKTALVTGSARGLGTQFARTLAASGARVILAGRSLASVEKLANEIRAGGGSCELAEIDVGSTASITAAGDALRRADILVNNAGVAWYGPTSEQTEADWDSVIDINLKGLFTCCQIAATGMQERGGGSIINIASVFGLRQGKHLLAYCTSKAAVIQLTKTLALEWAPLGIRVNAIAPGHFLTDMNAGIEESDEGKALINRIPQQRLGTVEELDGPLLLLASDASSYMTGSVIVVDGGQIVSNL